MPAPPTHSAAAHHLVQHPLRHVRRRVRLEQPLRREPGSGALVRLVSLEPAEDHLLGRRAAQPRVGGVEQHCVRLVEPSRVREQLRLLAPGPRWRGSEAREGGEEGRGGGREAQREGGEDGGGDELRLASRVHSAVGQLPPGARQMTRLQGERDARAGGQAGPALRP